MDIVFTCCPFACVNSLVSQLAADVQDAATAIRETEHAGAETVCVTVLVCCYSSLASFQMLRPKAEDRPRKLSKERRHVVS
jgi:hypothetical protein